MNATKQLDCFSYRQGTRNLLLTVLFLLFLPSRVTKSSLDGTIREISEESLVAPAVTRRTKRYAPAVTRRTKRYAPAVTRRTKRYAPAVTRRTKRYAPAVTRRTKRYAPAVTRRTKRYAPAVTCRTKRYAPAVTRRSSFCLFSPQGTSATSALAQLLHALTQLQARRVSQLAVFP